MRPNEHLKRYIVVNEHNEVVTCVKQANAMNAYGTTFHRRGNLVDLANLSLEDAKRVVRKAKTRLGRRYKIVEVE